MSIPAPFSLLSLYSSTQTLTLGSLQFLPLVCTTRPPLLVHATTVTLPTQNKRLIGYTDQLTAPWIRLYIPSHATLDCSCRRLADKLSWLCYSRCCRSW